MEIERYFPPNCKDDKRWDSPIFIFVQRTIFGNMHAGIIYKLDSGKFKRLHLRFHNNLGNDDIEPQIDGWSKSAFPASRLNSIRGLCNLISKNPQRIPYGLKIPRLTKFEVSGELKIDKTESGLLHLYWQYLELLG